MLRRPVVQCRSCSTTTSTNPAASSSSSQPLGVGEREHPRRVRVGRLGDGRARSVRGSGSWPTGCARARPTPRARAGRRGAAPAGSPAAPRRDRRRTSAPAAEHGVDARRSRDRSTRDRAAGTRRSSDSRAPGRARARRRASASAASVEISVPPGLDQLGGQEPRVARPGGELEHALAGLQRELLDHPDRHGHPEVADRRRPRRPSRGASLPALEHLGVGVGHQSLLLRQAARDLVERASICVLSRSWKIVISASEAAGRSRSIASSISGQRSAGMSACANGFHTSVMNSFTNERETESQWRWISAMTASAARSGIPLRDRLVGDRQQRWIRRLVLVAARAGSGCPA